MTTETETAFAELLDEVGATQRRHGRAALGRRRPRHPARGAQVDPLHPAGGRRRPACGRTRPGPASSRSSARTRSGAATTPTPSTATPPIDPRRTYRVRVEPGDAVYLSLTVYGGPTTAATPSASSAPSTAGGATGRPTAPSTSSSRPTEPDDPASAWIQLEPDAVAAITRDYLDDPVTGRRAALAHRGRRPAGDLPPGRRRPGPALPGLPDLGARAGEHRAASPWATPNAIDPPYPVPDHHLRLGGR